MCWYISTTFLFLLIKITIVQPHSVIPTAVNMLCVSVIMDYIIAHAWMDIQGMDTRVLVSINALLYFSVYIFND